MLVYTVRQFRKKVKEALDAVVAGEEVVLTRRGEVFILKVPLNPEAYVKPPKKGDPSAK